jgi:hypothetical protein
VKAKLKQAIVESLPAIAAHGKIMTHFDVIDLILADQLVHSSRARSLQLVARHRPFSDMVVMETELPALRF